MTDGDWLLDDPTSAYDEDVAQDIGGSDILPIDRGFGWEIDREAVDLGSFNLPPMDVNQEEFGVIAGDPVQDAYYYHAQTYDDTCAVVAQQGILKAFGIELTESDLREVAYVNGWYQPGTGTSMEGIGGLLEHAGIPVHRVHGASLDDLIAELDKGHKVIVGLDANEIWAPKVSFDPFNWWRTELPDAGHAVWITGIDADEGVVYMNDSGVPDGQGRAVAIPDFLNSWDDWGNYYCATDVVPSAIRQVYSAS